MRIATEGAEVTENFIRGSRCKTGTGFADFRGFLVKYLTQINADFY